MSTCIPRFYIFDQFSPFLCYFLFYQVKASIVYLVATKTVLHHNLAPMASSMLFFFLFRIPQYLNIPLRDFCRAVLLFNYPLLRLQQVFSPLDNLQHALLSACRSPDGRFHAQRPLRFHVIRKSTWTKRYFELFSLH